jgi:ABC-type transport system involved in multi-copper enzyme maturation permease subunit
MARRSLLRRRRLWPLLLAALVAIAALLWWSGRPVAATAVAGGAALAGGFVLGVSALRALLSPGNSVVGVARTVVEEAVGTRVPLVLLVLAATGLPALPLVLDPTERLEYRMQFFLNWGLSGTGFLLALVTLVLACGSVCGDIDTQRIHMTLAKPIQRWQYLLGKWLGIVLLDLVLVALAGIGIYAFTQALRQSPELDRADRRAVEQEVLAARSSARPEHPQRDDFEKALAAAAEQMKKDDPSSFAADPDGARKRIRSRQLLEWHTIQADVVSSYLFTGLGRARAESQVVQLRMKPFANNVGIDRADVRFALWLNERPFPMRDGKHEEFTFASGSFHTITLPTSAIADDGTLLVTIANRNLVPPGETAATSISFSPGKGLEVLCRVGGFEGNFLRGLALAWAKLAMLAAAALAAASWLTFPVAVLTGLMVYVAASAQAFLADAIDIYTGLDAADASFTAMIRLRSSLLFERLNKLEWWDAVKTLLSYFGDAFLSLVPSFGAHDGVTQVATGRLISWGDAGWGLLVLAVAYPIVLLALGWLLLERRDLVNVSGG